MKLTAKVQATKIYSLLLRVDKALNEHFMITEDEAPGDQLHEDIRDMIIEIESNN